MTHNGIMTQRPQPPGLLSKSVLVTKVSMAMALALSLLLLPALSQAQRGNASRTWTSSDGRSLQGQLVSAGKGNVVIKVKGGQRYEFPLTRLSEADQDYIRELSAKGLTIEVGHMPAETRIPTQVKVEGGPQAFTTEHFEFHTDQKVSKAFISEAARVYEGTYQALSELPVGLKMNPPEGMDRFRGLFMSREAFQRELDSMNTPTPTTSGGGVVVPPRPRTSTATIAGVYSPKRKELLVPYTSLGARDSGSQKTLRKSSDTSTLVHEVVHQVMHDYLPLMPLWFTEGFSEYLNAVPYQNGRFEFKNLERGLKEHLAKKYRVRDGQVEMRYPEIVLTKMTENFPGDVMAGYQDSMLLFIYLMHFDRPDAVGAPIAAFLKNYDIDNFNPQQFIADYNAAVKKYNAERLIYNEKVTRYNAELTNFKAKVDAYNDRLDEIVKSRQLGLPDSQIPKPLPEPTDKPPTPPEKLVVPKILKDNPNGPTDVFANIHKSATKVVTRDRTMDELASRLRKAYADIGIHITFTESTGSSFGNPFGGFTPPKFPKVNGTP